MKMKNILVVEDDEDIREIVELLLIGEGYNPSTFENGSEFLAKIHSSNPEQIHLVILDVMLPDCTGIDLCEIIKTNSKTSKIPVLLMSAHATLQHFPKMNMANDFIQKPFDIYSFMEMVSLQLSA